MAKKKIGIGLISVGWMGTLHTRGYQGLASRYPDLQCDPVLIIAADPVRERGVYAQEQLGYREWSADYHDVIDHPEVDVISITAPNYLHHEIALAAGKAGKPFWIEKPVGCSAQETAEIAAMVAEQHLITTVGFNYRHAPMVEYAKRLIQDGEIGRITHLRSAFLNDYAADPEGGLSWRFERKRAGSGVLGDLMSHSVDMVHYLAGPIVDISAVTTTVFPKRPVAPEGGGSHFAHVKNGVLKEVENEDFATAMIRIGGGGIADGAVGTVEASRITVGPRCDLGIEVYGTNGAVKWSFERMNELEVTRGRTGSAHGFTRVFAGLEHGEYSNFQPGPGVAMGYDDLKVIEAKHFLASVLSGSASGPTLKDGLAVAEVLAAAELSAQTRAWQQVGGVHSTRGA